MISRQQAKNDFFADHFAGVGKMVAGGKCNLPKMALDEKDAGAGCSVKQKQAQKPKENNPCH